MASTQELKNILNQINANMPGAYAGNTTSDDTLKYQQQLSNLENNQPGEYQSKYQDAISGIMDQISNRKPFSYDFNADPLYQNYKDQYAKMGNEASMNAVANVSALTGGYGNSYAATAASQANQQYLTQLNNVIPELYNAAMSKYQNETEDLYKQFSMYGEQEDRDYSKYRDNVSDYQTNRGYYADRLQQSQANDQWNNTFNYNKYRDEVSDWQNNRDYYTGLYNNSVANDQWQAEFDYQKQRDAVSDSQWQAEMALQQAASRSSGGSSSSSSSGSKKISMSDADYMKIYDNASKAAVALAKNTSGNKWKTDWTSMYNAYEDYVGGLYDQGTINQADYDRLMSSLQIYGINSTYMK